jgi:hypothetical protein
MDNAKKIGAGAIVAILGYFGCISFFKEISVEPIAYTRAHAAFSGSIGIPFNDSVAEGLRSTIVSKCALVANQKLSTAAANQSISQIAQLVGGRSLTADIVAEIVSKNAQANPDATDEAECLSTLTLMRTAYPELWAVVDASSAGDDDLAGIGAIIDEASKP